MSGSSTSRRTLLGSLVAVASGLALSMAGPLRTLSARAQQVMDKVRPRRLPRWGMAIDLDLCTGCGACVVACSSENNVALTGREPGSEGTQINWMELVPRSDAAPEGASVPMQLLPAPCMHCDDPPCVKVCPVNATYKNEEGLVAQIWDRCIGCRYCQVACPYSRRYFNWKHEDLPETYLNYMNPDVARRPEGVVEKCTFCQHRIRKVKEQVRREEREIEDGDVRKLTACAQSCPAEAIVFGDLNDPESTVSRHARSPRASRLLEELGTEPKVYYLAKDRQE